MIYIFYGCNCVTRIVWRKTRHFISSPWDNRETDFTNDLIKVTKTQEFPKNYWFEVIFWFDLHTRIILGQSLT
jgi:hypothetical protein